MKSHVWWIIGGIIALIGGFFALLNPVPATLAVNFFAGWSFIMFGILALVGVFQLDRGRHKMFMAIFGQTSCCVVETISGSCKLI